MATSIFTPGQQNADARAAVIQPNEEKWFTLVSLRNNSYFINWRAVLLYVCVYMCVYAGVGVRVCRCVRVSVYVCLTQSILWHIVFHERYILTRNVYFWYHVLGIVLCYAVYIRSYTKKIFTRAVYSLNHARAERYKNTLEKEE